MVDFRSSVTRLRPKSTQEWDAVLPLEHSHFGEKEAI